MPITKNKDRIAFRISTPGCISLSGDIGRVQVLASIDLHTLGIFETRDKSFGESNLEFIVPRLSFHEWVLLKDILDDISSEPLELCDQVDCSDVNLASPELINKVVLMARVKNCLRNIETFRNLSENYFNYFSLIFIIIYSFYSLTNIPLKSFAYKVISEIPFNSESGHSQSLILNFIACLFHFFRCESMKKNKWEENLSPAGYKEFFFWCHDVKHFDDRECKLISSWGQFCEYFFTEQSVGFKCAACTYGNILLCQKEEGEIYPKLKILHNPQILKGILIDTGIPRDTSKSKKCIQSLKSKFANIIDDIFQLMDMFSYRIFEEIKRITDYTKSDQPQQQNSDLQSAEYEMHVLGELMDMVQAVLYSLRICSSNTNYICQVLQKYGYHCTSTGSGGGTYICVLIPPIDLIRTSQVRRLLECHDYSCFNILLGVPGMYITNFDVHVQDIFKEGL